MLPPPLWNKLMTRVVPAMRQPDGACRESGDIHGIVLTAYWATVVTTRSQIRRGLRVRHIVPFLAKRNTEHGSGLGRWRWVVERTFAWLNQFRRLRVRYEKRTDQVDTKAALPSPGGVGFFCVYCA